MNFCALLRRRYTTSWSIHWDPACVKRCATGAIVYGREAAEARAEREKLFLGRH